MNIILLNHQRELSKKFNTGSLVVEVLGSQAEVIVWERTNPSDVLLRRLSREPSVLLYPSANSVSLDETDAYQSYVVIDGTWQQAQKIYNRSPYLRKLPTVKIKANTPSIYTLRRNQRPGGLCTAECVVEVLRHRGLNRLADDLHSKLTDQLKAARHQNGR